MVCTDAVASTHQTSYNLNWNIFLLFTCLGIGRPPGQMDPKAFQLQKFNKSARERVNVDHSRFHFVLPVDLLHNLLFNEPDWWCIARRGRSPEDTLRERLNRMCKIHQHLSEIQTLETPEFTSVSLRIPSILLKKMRLMLHS